MIDPKNIRNFSIIAHIDHGKSTLADRLLELTKTINEREKKNQILDNMDLERERGITIKSQVATLKYISNDGKTYYLNLIDTPGHVDFSYEVSRALAACDGVLLVIDASQGVQAQTLANMYQALEHNLEIIPVINKIDLPTADPNRVLKQIDQDLGLDEKITVLISAKKGINIKKLLERIVSHCPAPKSSNETNETEAKALIFDAYFDYFKGVIMSVRIFDGEFKIGDQIIFFQHNNHYKIEELGHYTIKKKPKKALRKGEVGYIIANIKTLSDSQIGDTITTINNTCKYPLPGYKEVKPMVFTGIYPIDSSEYPELKDALEKLKLNDAALVYEKESSAALGFGFRCGFLGLLHIEIVSERLLREFKLQILSTAPSVEYHIILNNNQIKKIDNPNDFPERNFILKTKEPFVLTNIILPKKFAGNLIQLCHEKRGIQKNMQFLDNKRVQLDFEIPLAEIIYDFHDKLKSLSQGYASYDYNLIDHRQSNLVKVDILVNQEKVDAFSQIIHKDKANIRARLIVEKLKEEIPRHLFQVPIQAAIGSKIIARENIQAFRKNVTVKCYGGDITRKRKLLEKQKAGKKRMKQIGSVDIPQKAFLSILKIKE